MIKPALLKTGDRIAIVAPARKVQPADVAKASEVFKSWGLEVAFGSNLHSNAHSYLAGSDQQRLTDLQSVLDNADIKAVISARGGYGTTRILDRVNLNALQRNPKWIIGFSDVTALHLRLLKAGIMSVHATMPVLFGKADAAKSVESLRRILFEKNFSLQAEPCDDNKKGEASGRLVGGNLSLVADSLGTSTEPDMTNAILMIEEIDEYRYRIDRMMTQLKRAGKLASLSGLVVGHMTDIKESELPFGESVEKIILNVVEEYDYPVAFKFPFGHENPNLAWRHGELVTLKVDQNGASIFAANDLQ
jgi:muramoyltetrapeptide carboxypeptidase